MSKGLDITIKQLKSTAKDRFFVVRTEIGDVKVGLNWVGGQGNAQYANLNIEAHPEKFLILRESLLSNDSVSKTKTSSDLLNHACELLEEYACDRPEVNVFLDRVRGKI